MSLEKVIDLLVNNFNPYSIFLYGSRATDSYNNDSDYEIGVIFKDEAYVSRNKINELINDKDYAIYPFKLSEVVNYDIDTPFEKNIYMSVLTSGAAKTLYGEKVLENLESPKITSTNLLADINFNLGLALASVRVYKSGNIDLANDMFYKSCLYATRDLIYYLTHKLCLSYNEIYEYSKNIDIINEYKNLIETAYNLRNKKIDNIDSKMYFKNISYINKYVLKKIK